jgi:hypothetical protein
MVRLPNGNIGSLVEIPLLFPVASNVVVHLQFYGDDRLDRESIEQLIERLQMTLDYYPARAALARPEADDQP